MKALVIRQPWAWLIVHGYKDIENRSWSTNFRGKFLVSASQRLTEKDYWNCYGFVMSVNEWIPDMNMKIQLPRKEDLQRGGIVGQVELVDCVSDSKSLWFEGPYGFVLKNFKTLPFRPLKGRLGFFDVK
jgi:hypothetical protein